MDTSEPDRGSFLARIPILESIPSLARLAVATAGCATLGWALAPELPGVLAAPAALALLSLGLLFGTVSRAERTASTLTRGLLAVGGALGAGFLGRDSAFAWPLLVAGLAFAAGAGRDLFRPRLGAVAAAIAVALVAVQDRVLGTTLGDVLLVAEAVVAGAFLGRHLELSLDLDEDAAHQAVDGPLAQVRAAGRRLGRLLAALNRRGLTRPELVRRVMRAVKDSQADAVKQAARLRVAAPPGPESDEVARRIAELQARLAAERDPTLRREIALALERQREHLGALDALDRDTSAFALRLLELRDGIEALEVALRRSAVDVAGPDCAALEALVETELAAQRVTARRT